MKKIGIIIVFHNNEKDINKKLFIQKLKRAKNLELCLVNNASKDYTFQILREISDACPNVSLINIKKFKSEVSAVRAGARFMSSEFNLAHLGYVCTSLINYQSNGLDGLVKTIFENRNQIINCDITAIEKSKLKQTLFKSLFSVIDYLKKIKVQNNFINVQTLSRL